MYYGLLVISLSLGRDIVNFQQLLRLWGKLMIKYRRPDLLVWTLLLPGQCHKDKTFILICLKAKLFHANHIYFLEQESRTYKMATEMGIFYFILASIRIIDTVAWKRNAQKCRRYATWNIYIFHIFQNFHLILFQIVKKNLEWIIIVSLLHKNAHTHIHMLCIQYIQ